MQPIATNLRQLEYVVCVADLGSTAAAARSLNVSQPSISLAITNLERHFGQPVFQRIAGQSLQLTPFGRAKLPEFRRLLSEARTILRPDGGAQSRHQLTLGVFSTLGPLYVPRLIRLFLERYPGSQVQLVEDDLQGLTDGLASGRLDLAILYDVGLPREIAITELRAIRPYALVPEGHGLAGTSPVELGQLLQDPLVLIDLPHSRGFFLSIAQLQPGPVRIAAETGSIEMVRSMVANGLGVGLLATDIPYSLTYDGGSVVRLEIAGDIPSHRIVMANAASLPLTNSAAAFLEIAVATLREPPR